MSRSNLSEFRCVICKCPAVDYWSDEENDGTIFASESGEPLWVCQDCTPDEIEDEFFAELGKGK
jgi:Zn-finger protein